MKELSIEQKAKLYDEAIKKAKEFKNNPFAGYDGTDLISALFPELKESEDEKIRKALRKRIINYDPNNEILIKEEGISQRQFLAWIEKQGEQSHWKPTEEQLQTLHAQLNEGAVTYPDDKRVLTTLYEDLMKITTQEEKKNWQKPADKVEPRFNVGDKVLWKYDKSVVRNIIDVSDSGTYWIECPGCSSGWWSEQELEPYVNKDEQKSAWSENDKEQLDRAIYMMGQLGLTKSWDDVYNWLKSLKDRILI